MSDKNRLKHSFKIKILNFQCRAHEQERSLRDSINQLRSEAEEMNAYCAQRDEEQAAKVEELLTRLQEQTTLAQRLQRELDEYEYYEEDDDGNMVERDPDAKVDLVN